MLHRGIRRAWYKYVAPQIESSFVAMYHYYFESLKDFIAAFNPHSEAFQGDYANYTNIQLKIQINEVQISKQSNEPRKCG
jgi:uncharacterized protein (TIGR02118 family)